MRIGIVGAGMIGSTLAKLCVDAGHAVRMASRHPEELQPVVERLGKRASAGGQSLHPDRAVLDRRFHPGSIDLFLRRKRCKSVALKPEQRGPAMRLFHSAREHADIEKEWQRASETERAAERPSVAACFYVPTKLG